MLFAHATFATGCGLRSRRARGWRKRGVIVYIYDRTGSTTWVAALTASKWIPGCSWLGRRRDRDRYDRARVMVWSAMASFVVTRDRRVSWQWTFRSGSSSHAGADAATFAPYARSGRIDPRSGFRKDIVAPTASSRCWRASRSSSGPPPAGCCCSGEPVSGIISTDQLPRRAAIAQRLRCALAAVPSGGNMVKQWAIGLQSLGAHRTRSCWCSSGLDSAIYGLPRSSTRHCRCTSARDPRLQLPARRLCLARDRGRSRKPGERVVTTCTDHRRSLFSKLCPSCSRVVAGLPSRSSCRSSRHRMIIVDVLA